MNRRQVQKYDTKCNLCFNWFQISVQNHQGYSICESCQHKAQTTSNIKLVSQSGSLYQLYLAERHPSNSESLLSKVDEYMHTQIRSVIEKWDQIIHLFTSSSRGNKNSNCGYFWHSVYNILKADFRAIEASHLETIKCVKEELSNRDRTTTPLKSRILGVSNRGLNKYKSMKKILRNYSKVSLRTYDGRDRSAKKCADNYNYVCRSQVSPNTMKRSTSFKAIENKENRQYAMKVQNIKNHIVDVLEDREQIGIPYPVNLMKEKVFDALEHTKCTGKSIELVSYPQLQNLDIKSFLKSLEWEDVEILKLVKVGLTDEQLFCVLDFIRDKYIYTLVLTSNNLTEESCRILLDMPLKNLKNIYMGKNQIIGSKAKAEIKYLQADYNLFL